MTDEQYCCSIAVFWTPAKSQTLSPNIIKASKAQTPNNPKQHTHTHGVILHESNAIDAHSMILA